jgi:hypothetical protein
MSALATCKAEPIRFSSRWNFAIIVSNVFHPKIVRAKVVMRRNKS